MSDLSSGQSSIRHAAKLASSRPFLTLAMGLPGWYSLLGGAETVVEVRSETARQADVLVRGRSLPKSRAQCGLDTALGPGRFAASNKYAQALRRAAPDPVSRQESSGQAGRRCNRQRSYAPSPFFPCDAFDFCEQGPCLFSQLSRAPFPVGDCAGQSLGSAIKATVLWRDNVEWNAQLGLSLPFALCF